MKGSRLQNEGQGSDQMAAQHHPFSNESCPAGVFKHDASRRCARYVGEVLNISEPPLSVLPAHPNFLGKRTSSSQTARMAISTSRLIVVSEKDSVIQPIFVPDTDSARLSAADVAPIKRIWSPRSNILSAFENESPGNCNSIPLVSPYWEKSQQDQQHQKCPVSHST